MNILVTVDKFGKDARILLDSYSNTHNIIYNLLGRKITQKELKEYIDIHNPHLIIAGTEKYDVGILNACTNLIAISRVGIGTDAIDLIECEKRKIQVLNTPDAPTNAVVELTIGQILNASRRIQEVDKLIRLGKWIRPVGKDLNECTVGIIGHGRIGSLLANKIKPLVSKVYVNDIDPAKLTNTVGEIVDIKTLFTNSDIITLHIPFSKENKNFIDEEIFGILKKDCILINTSRGGILNERSLYNWLTNNKDSIGVIDVFENEPYSGELTSLDNCYLSSHIGSCTVRSRKDMEVGAVNNIFKWISLDLVD